MKEFRITQIILNLKRHKVPPERNFGRRYRRKDRSSLRDLIQRLAWEKIVRNRKKLSKFQRKSIKSTKEHLSNQWKIIETLNNASKMSFKWLKNTKKSKICRVVRFPWLKVLKMMGMRKQINNCKSKNLSWARKRMWSLKTKIKMTRKMLVNNS